MSKTHEPDRIKSVVARLLTSTTVALVLSTSALATEELFATSWSVASGDADSSEIADLMKNALFDGVDTRGMSEVQNQDWADAFEIAAEDGEGADFDQVLGTTGGGDRLLIVFDSDRFELVASEELDHINIGGHVRAPLVARFRITSTGDEFLFVVNHLYRSRADRRHQQAIELNTWASGQQLPIICVGDFNFDWNLPDGETDHDQGYDNLIANSVFEWVRPATLIKTQASTSYNSVLDFVFLTPDHGWTADSEIVDSLGLFPDQSDTPDHRPLIASISVAASTPDTGDSLKEQILQKIATIEAELAALKILLDELDQ